MPLRPPALLAGFPSTFCEDCPHSSSLVSSRCCLRHCSAIAACASVHAWDNDKAGSVLVAPPFAKCTADSIRLFREGVTEGKVVVLSESAMIRAPDSLGVVRSGKVLQPLCSTVRTSELGRWSV